MVLDRTDLNALWSILAALKIKFISYKSIGNRQRRTGNGLFHSKRNAD